MAIALLLALGGWLWMRRGELEGNGESGALLLGLVLCFISVVLILVVLAGNFWS